MTNEQVILFGGLCCVGVFYFVKKSSEGGEIVSGTQSKAINIIKEYEGFSAKVYNDTAGKPTIGYGHLIKAGESFPNGITKTQAEVLLSEDMKIAINAVDRLVTVSLNANQKAALVSLVFNIGSQNFTTSTLRRKLNSGDKTAYLEFDRWVYSGGKATQGLVNRRAKEKQLFVS